MTLVRRVYLYVVTAAGLLAIAAGVTNLGEALVLAITAGGERLLLAGVRSRVALGGAAALVGLPVWLLHWTWIRRALRETPDERAAVLRRLYLYGVLAVTAAVAWISLAGALDGSLRLAVAGSAASSPTRALLPVPLLLVAAGLWWYHRRAVLLDRAAAGETGAGATLRRWYRYGLSFVSLLTLLVGASLLVRLLWHLVLAPDGGSPLSNGALGVAAQSASILAALAIWLLHWSGWSIVTSRGRPDLEAADAASTLRPVYLFLALAFSVVVTLVGTWQIVYYALGRALGEATPGGVGGDLWLALSGPASLVLAYGASWAFHRRALEQQALVQEELPRQAGVRRLYQYLLCLVSLAVLAAGTGGLLWTLADLVTGAPQASATPGWWRDRISLFASIALVGLPVWLLHWRGATAARPAIGEVRSLARRLYVYAALLAGVLALLASGVAAVKQVLDLALGEAATAGAVTNLARALSVAAVAAFVVAYHQLVLRRDSRVEAQQVPQAPEAHQARPVPIRAFPDASARAGA
ncbi:MAG TPA: DUF5671 domain-containing protein [Chloroflexota bacterium]|nr:DUF5671 domain-containing protein [Chloroflexota bacterium]